MVDNAVWEEVPLNILELQRKRLEYIVEVKDYNLQDEQVVKASQWMDQAILLYYSKKKALVKTA